MKDDVHVSGQENAEKTVSDRQNTQDAYSCYHGDDAASGLVLTKKESSTNTKQTNLMSNRKDPAGLKEISSQMTGRFSSPENALMQGRNNGVMKVPQSTASFKLKLMESSGVIRSQGDQNGEHEIAMDLQTEGHQESAEKPASFLATKQPTVTKASHILASEDLSLSNENIFQGRINMLQQTGKKLELKENDSKDQLRSTGAAGQLDSPEKKQPQLVKIKSITKVNNVKGEQPSQQNSKRQHRSDLAKATVTGESKHQKSNNQESRRNEQVLEEGESLELKKQSQSANMNLISYQTANFGPNGQTRPIGNNADRNDAQQSPQLKQSGQSQTKEPAAQEDQEREEQQKMYASMGDIT